MSSNIVLHIPHASTYLTAVDVPIVAIMSGATGAFVKFLMSQFLPMTDWYTDELFINGIGVPVVAPVSRIICDVERFRDDEKEPMAKIGMGVCYEKSYDLKHNIVWRKGHKEWVLENIYDIHHKIFELAVDRAMDEKPYKALIIDCHSFSPVPLPYEPDQNPDRPDICLGIDSFHTPDWLVNESLSFFKSKGYSVKVNSPYSGTMVPIRHYKKNKWVESIMIELNRGLYLKEGTNEKNDYFPVLKQHIAEYQQEIK